jgi:hypothetical protein
VHANNERFNNIISAYAQRRDEKLPALSGGEKYIVGKLPRYVQFLSEVSFNETETKVELVTASGQIIIEKEPETLAVSNANFIGTTAPLTSKIECGDSVGICGQASEEKMLNRPTKFYEPDISQVKSGKILVPPKKIMKHVGQAIRDWNMIQEVSNQYYLDFLVFADILNREIAYYLGCQVVKTLWLYSMSY